MTRIRGAGCLLIAVATLVGCDRRESSSGASRPAAPAMLPTGSAAIVGRVIFNGQPLPANLINVTDPGCNCQELIEPGLKRSADGGLADAIVYVESPPAGDGSTRPSLTLDQVHCNYEPHVLAVQTRQPVIIRSSDPTMHNVRYQSARNGSRNLTMSSAGETIPTRFAEPEFIHFQCDVHPWMSAHVGVFDHPYFGTTDTQGRFRIGSLPAGQYTLVVWHELLGTCRQPVTVHDGSSEESPITISIELPKAGQLK